MNKTIKSKGSPLATKLVNIFLMLILSLVMTFVAFLWNITYLFFRSQYRDNIFAIFVGVAYVVFSTVAVIFLFWWAIKSIKRLKKSCKQNITARPDDES